MLDPVEIAFFRDWNPARGESTTGKLLRHLVDKREARGTRGMQMNREQVEAELSHLFDGMASDLRAWIDATRIARSE